MSERRQALLELVKNLPEDFAPYGTRERTIPDCSHGCRFALPLAGELGADWLVCSNPASHRAGLLTFEHQGCEKFEPDAFIGVDFAKPNAEHAVRIVRELKRAVRDAADLYFGGPRIAQPPPEAPPLPPTFRLVCSGCDNVWRQVIPAGEAFPRCPRCNAEDVFDANDGGWPCAAPGCDVKVGANYQGVCDDCKAEGKLPP